MNIPELALLTIGDLELERRRLLTRIQELEQQLAELTAAGNGQPGWSSHEVSAPAD